MRPAQNIQAARQMRTLALSLLMSLAISPLTYGYTFAEYDWIEYNGHFYARTLDYASWDQAEAWAQEVGGHLVTINDAAENAWLSAQFAGLYRQGHEGITHDSLVWIGLHNVGGTWVWADGTPLTISPWYWVGPLSLDPGSGGMAYVYLHTATHPRPGTWWNHDFSLLYPSYGVIEIDSLSQSICASINIDPDVLNLGSEGKYITCYITLPEGYDVSNVDPPAILLNGQIPPAWSIVEEQENLLKVKFDRSDLQVLLQPGQVELTVTGFLQDGTLFEGTDTIRVIDPSQP